MEGPKCLALSTTQHFCSCNSGKEKFDAFATFANFKFTEIDAEYYKYCKEEAYFESVLLMFIDKWTNEIKTLTLTHFKLENEHDIIAY